MSCRRLPPRLNCQRDESIQPPTMVDNLSPNCRSHLMSRIRGKNTAPELAVSRIVHALGYRFRLHRGDLPGRPDLVFPSRQKIIFVHGCYWHRHDCKKATTPKTNIDFWQKKFDDNVVRDMKNLNDLADLGWEALIVWQCETERPEELSRRMVGFLGQRP
jgi:DNA mismatch endonuclease, patch repair protein